MKLRISYLIFFSFLFILLLFSIATYINYRSSEEVRKNTEYLTQSSTIVRQSSRFQRNILSLVSGLRGYLLTGEKYFLQVYDSATTENNAILAELDSLMSEQSPQKRNLKEIAALHNQWISSYATPLRNAKLTSGKSIANLDSFNKLFKEKLVSGEEQRLNHKLQQKFKEFTNLEYSERQQRLSTQSERVTDADKISFYLTVFSIVLGILVAAFLAMGISRRLSKMVDMANNIAAGNYDMQLKDDGQDEISLLNKSLNNMANVLSENISQLKRKNKELDQFAHIVSHDLKAPLRGIDNVVSWIEEDHGGELSTKVNEYLQMIKGRISRGENLIEGILSYARIGKEKLNEEPVNIKELVEEIVEVQEAPPSFQFIISPSLPTVKGERILLLQVFSNLISNAVKYNNKAIGKLNVYHKEHTTYFEFFVADNGPGISEAHHDRIFLIFQTLQERDTFESTGVGLAIVRKILDERGEKIKVNSKSGEGAVFSFTWTKI